MTIEQLQYFQAIQKFMSFSLAAEDMCISQSSISKQIIALENELSVKLFSRNTRNISLTSAGTEFAVHARRILEEYDKAICNLRDYSFGKKRSISITSIPVMNHYKVTDMIALFEKEHPDVSMSITEKDGLYVAKSLENPDTDLVILRTGFMPYGKYKLFPLIEDELVLVTNSSHRFADREIIQLSEAVNENFILLSADTGLYNFCLEVCSKAGFSPHTLHTNIRIDTIKNFILQGTGVSLMMKKVAEYFADPRIRILKLEEKPVLTLSIIARNNRLTPVCSEFIKFATAYFAGLLQI